MVKNIESSFIKANGERIPNIIEYLKEIISKDDTSTITIGCDSIQIRRRTLYAITIMIYNNDIRNGAHVVFFRESCPKIRDTQERLYKEAQYLHDIGIYINDRLSEFYTRKDLSDDERKRYKYHLLKSSGEVGEVSPIDEESFIKRLVLTEADRIDYKLVDLHVDFNPFSGASNRNKSFIAYKSYVPWLRALNFRVWGKPAASAASSGADFLLKRY